MTHGFIKDEYRNEALEESDDLYVSVVWNESVEDNRIIIWLWLKYTKPSQIKETHDHIHHVCHRVMTHEFHVGSDNGTTDIYN
jgi:hypothetical protein